MENIIRIDLETQNGVRVIETETGTRLYELAERYYENENGYIPVFASLNGEGSDLLHRLSRPCSVRFIDLTERMARLTYQRSLYFVFLLALHRQNPDLSPSLKYPLNDGIYIEIEPRDEVSREFLWGVEKTMRELIRENILFSRTQYLRAEILSDYPPEKMSESDIEFVRNSDIQDIFIYSYEGFQAVFYDPLMQSSGNLGLFEMVPYERGIILRVPQKENPTHIPEYRDDRKLFQMYDRMLKWQDFLKVRTLRDLNRKIERGEWRDLILINEAIHEKRIAEIADQIVTQKKRIILIAGPSSSGKTTFAQRLCIQLRVNGQEPLYMGTDDYFIERDQAPRDANGNFNFEDLEAVDVRLFNEQMNALLRGDVVDMPVFDFITGSKRYGTRITYAKPGQPIVIEGIHALNDRLTEQIAEAEKFRIYISPLTTLNIDDNNRVPVTDIRLLRRMARDMRSRGKTPRETIQEWESVRDGEIKNIFPYNSRADAMFNSAFLYELSVIRPIVEWGLKEIRRGEPQYLEAQRLLRILRCVRPMNDPGHIGLNSIMREFVGGGIWVK